MISALPFTEAELERVTRLDLLNVDATTARALRHAHAVVTLCRKLAGHMDQDGHVNAKYVQDFLNDLYVYLTNRHAHGRLVARTDRRAMQLDVLSPDDEEDLQEVKVIHTYLDVVQEVSDGECPAFKFVQETTEQETTEQETTEQETTE